LINQTSNIFFIKTPATTDVKAKQFSLSSQFAKGFSATFKFSSPYLNIKNLTSQYM